MESIRRSITTKFLFFAASLCLYAALGGCLSPINDKYPYKDGWQHAEFIGLVNDGIPDVHLSIDCRQESDVATDDGKAFILVKHLSRKGRWFHDIRYWVVLADNAQQLKVGRVLYVNSKDCRLAAVLEEYGNNKLN